MSLWDELGGGLALVFGRIAGGDEKEIAVDASGNVQVDVLSSTRTLVKTNATGAAAIATTLTVPAGLKYRLLSVGLHFNLAPTTAEAFTVTLNAVAGAAYDTLLYTIDPSVLAVTDLFWQPDQKLVLTAGDAIDVAYTNTDTRTYGLQITAEEV